MSLKDFKNILQCLSKCSESIKDELISLYVEINSTKSNDPTITSISAECIQFLSFNLQTNPYPTVVLIQQLLCLWNTKFHRTDNALQDLYIDTLDILINRFDSGYDIAVVKLYSLLAQLKLTATKMTDFKIRIIPKLLGIVKNKKMNNNKELYLCLLSQYNLQILKQLQEQISVKTSEHRRLNNSSDIFIKSLKSKQHWFQIMLANSALDKNQISIKFIEILNFIKLISEANSSSLKINNIENIDELLSNIKNIYDIDNFIKDFSLEIHRQILIIKFCLEHTLQKDPNIHSIFEVIRGNSCLSTLSRFIDLSDMKIWNKCSQMLKLNRNSQPDIYTIDPKTMVLPNWDLILFRSYCIMINLIQCVTTTNICNAEQYFLHVTSVLNESKQEILNLEKLELQIEVIENIFALIFIRYEHFSEDEENDTTTKMSGFICNELILRDVLDLLKYCIYEIKSGVILSDVEVALNKRIFHIEKYVNEGLSRLYFLTNDHFFQNVGVFSDVQKIDYCRCDDSSGVNIEQYYSLDIESSESESDANLERARSVLTSIESRSTSSQDVPVISRTNSFLSDINTSPIDDNIRMARRRRMQSRRSETEKSSEGSETTVSSGKSRRKYPKRSNNNDAIRERRYLLNFMLASPQSLLCLCLAQGDYERVQKVVNMYNLENSHIASNVLFTKNLQDLRSQLRTLFDKVEPENSNENLSPEASLIQTIKKVTGSAYDTTQVINITEQFFSTHLLSENKDSKMIIERFSSVYPFLNNYAFNNELFMQVFDICLTLGTTYDQSVTLLKCACRHTHNFENNSEYSTFYENIKKCHQECNSIFIKQSPNISITKMLLAYKYPLNSKQLTKKFTLLKILKENFAKFYANDLLYQISTPSCLANSSLIKISQNISDYYKTIEATKPVNYLQRFQNYVTLLSRIYEIANISIESCFTVLETKRSKIVDKVVFESQIKPIELENIFRQSNLDLIFHLVMNCCPKIECQIVDDTTYNFRHTDLNAILVELIEKINKSDIQINNIHEPNRDMLTYIQNNNELLLYLLVLMYPQSHGEHLIDLDSLNTTCIDNLINLNRVQQLQTLYESNKVVTALQNHVEPVLLYKHLLQSQHNVKADIKILYSLTERQIKSNSNITGLKDALAYSLVSDIKSTDSCKYVELITNISLQMVCCLNNLKQWSGADCIRILKKILSNFTNCIDCEMRKNLKDLLNKIRMYEHIRGAIDSDSWYAVYVKCEQYMLNDNQQINNEYDPTSILKHLIILNKMDLVMNWINSHSVDAYLLHLFNADFIKQIFDSKIDYEMIEVILNQLPIKLVEIICHNLFKSIRNVKQLQFLMDYIIKLNSIDPSNYHNVKVGIKIMAILHPSVDEDLWTLIDQPLLILEQFLMNTKLEKLAYLIKSIKTLLPETIDESLISISTVDNLLRAYAEKALEFGIRIKTDESDGGSGVTQSNRSMDGSPNHLLQSIDSLNTVCSEKEVFVMPDEPPLKSEWMNDYDTNICLCCHETVFSMFNRRHHCRRCGRVVCGSCSRRRLKISIYGDLHVRVCNQCYELTTAPDNIDKNTSSAADRTESDIFIDYWQLSNNAAHNASIRDEFFFEYAPSVSLCLSILKLHSQNENYSNFLLNQSNVILRMVLSLKVAHYNEIDYNMVFQMLRSLIVAAKVNSARNSYDSKLALCDQLLGQIDILHLLAANDCLDLLPTNFVSENFKYKRTAISGLSLRKLRDNLMEHEKWNLALEISTKTGLDTTGVFAVWGKACLKAGCFQQAREIFQHCLDKINEDNIDSDDSEKLSWNRLRHSETRLSNISIGSTNRPPKNPALITEIIEILESSTCIFDSVVLKNAEISRNHKPQVKSNVINSTAISVGSTDSALHILNKLTNLKNISAGNFNTLYPDGDLNATHQRPSTLSRKNSRQQQFKPENYKVYMDQCVHDECIYYLRTYGSHFGVIDYYLQRRNVREAVTYLQENNLSSDYYVELYIHCLKNGCTDYLQQILLEIDNTLDTWKDGLRHICRYLEQNGLLNVLYQIQEWLGDHVRAAMTCIKFYSLNASCYTELLGNLEYLHKAQAHLKYELESDNQWVQVEPVKKNDHSEKSLVLKMNSREIDKHINTIWRQIEITKFLASNEKHGRKTIDKLPEMFQFTNDGCNSSKSVHVPTLFGSKLEKIQLAVLAIISGENITEGFGIAFRIIQDFQLNSSKVYCIVAKQLAIKQNCVDIQTLVDCIATSGISEDSSSVVCDEVIALSIRTICADISGVTVQIESLIKLIQDVNIKITAYIDSKQLKSAYLLAIRHDRIRDIRRILREAERLNQPHIRSICIKRLSQIKGNHNEKTEY